LSTSCNIQSDSIDNIAGFILDYGSLGSIGFVISAHLVSFTVYMFLLLKRTEMFGFIIMMVEQLSVELTKYLSAVGVVILTFFVVLRYTHLNFKNTKDPLFDSFQDILNAFLGHSKSEVFSYPWGLMYILTVTFVLKILFFSLLVTMFILRCLEVSKNIDAKKRMEIIKQKNISGYDDVYGAITMTSYPVNVVIIPFMASIVMMKSQRLNNTVLLI